MCYLILHYAVGSSIKSICLDGLTITLCWRIHWPKQKMSRDLSICPSNMFLGESESVEKIILQQHPLGITSQSAPGWSAQMAISASANKQVTTKEHCWGMNFSTDSRFSINTFLRKNQQTFWYIVLRSIYSTAHSRYV